MLISTHGDLLIWDFLGMFFWLHSLWLRKGKFSDGFAYSFWRLGASERKSHPQPTHFSPPILKRFIL